MRSVNLQFNYCGNDFERSVNLDHAFIPSKKINYCLPMPEIKSGAFLDLEFITAGRFGSVIIKIDLVVDGVVNSLMNNEYKLFINYAVMGGITHDPLTTICSIAHVKPNVAKPKLSGRHNKFIPSPDHGYGRARK